MSDNVIHLGNITKLDLPAERVLDGAKEWASGGVVVMGWDDDGNISCASSIADGREVLWILEQAKKRLLEVEDSD